MLPRYSKGEEIFNMVSHIVGGAVGIAAIPACVVTAALHGNVYGVVSGAIFGATMLMLYCMSRVKSETHRKKGVSGNRPLHDFRAYRRHLHTVYAVYNTQLQQCRGLDNIRGDLGCGGTGHHTECG